MELQTFVAETLTQIVEGVTQARSGAWVQCAPERRAQRAGPSR
jgi:hypothetical protein